MKQDKKDIVPDKTLLMLKSGVVAMFIVLVTLGIIFAILMVIK